MLKSQFVADCPKLLRRIQRFVHYQNLSTVADLTSRHVLRKLMSQLTNWNVTIPVRLDHPTVLLVQCSHGEQHVNWFGKRSLLLSLPIPCELPKKKDTWPIVRDCHFSIHVTTRHLTVSWSHLIVSLVPQIYIIPLVFRFHSFPLFWSQVYKIKIIVKTSRLKIIYGFWYFSFFYGPSWRRSLLD